MSQIIALIQQLSHGEFISGQLLAERLGVSRTTISSWVKQLASFGLEVSRVQGRGYRLQQPIYFIEKDRILNHLSTEAQSLLGRIDIFAETDSTNKRALEADYEDHRWQLMVSEFQNGGRGRRGRQWLSPLGTNLLFTLSKKDHWPAEVLFKASIIVGIALAKALQRYVDCSEDVQIKWPNDVYIKGRKLAGILCELQGSPVDEALLAIGVGINIHSEPVGEGICATKLASHALETLNRSSVLATLVSELIRSFEQAQNGNLQEIMADWSSLDYLAGKEVRVLMGDRVIDGIARGINEQAELRIELPSGAIQVFNGGEVSVRL